MPEQNGFVVGFPARFRAGHDVAEFPVQGVFGDPAFVDMAS